MTKEVHALVIDAEGNAEFTYVKADLATLKSYVGGGYLEPFGDQLRTWHGYCDEDGKNKGLPVNENATVIARALGWVGAPGDYLVGPVIFLGDDPMNPHEEADFPPEATGKVVRMFNAQQN